MKTLVVIVGTHASGKSTLVRQFCEEKHKLEYISNDEIVRQQRRIFRVKGFNIEEVGKWERMDRLGDLGLLSFYLHVVLFQQVKGAVVLAEGARYFVKEERNALEVAAEQVHPGSRIHYCHLDPPLDLRNRYRRLRGRPDIAAYQLSEALRKYELSFIDFRIEGIDDLEAVVGAVCGELTPGVRGKRLVLPRVKQKPSNLRDIDLISVRVHRGGGVRNRIRAKCSRMGLELGRGWRKWFR